MDKISPEVIVSMGADVVRTDSFLHYMVQCKDYCLIFSLTLAKAPPLRRYGVLSRYKFIGVVAYCKRINSGAERVCISIIAETLRGV